jgi:hypothetical protein
MFAGGSRRILERHVKCKSTPVPLKDWAMDGLAKMGVRHREKGAVKDMESMFDDIKEGATQTKLTGSTKNKGAGATATTAAVSSVVLVAILRVPHGTHPALRFS